MTEDDRSEAMRQAAREALREQIRHQLAVALAEGTAGPGPSRNGHSANGVTPASGGEGTASDVVPVVPAPPVAAVLRPSSWQAPAVPGEVIGDVRAQEEPTVAPPGGRGATVHPAPAHDSDAQVQAVTIDTDEDLEAFVRTLVARLENPRDRLAIKAGKLRFSLRRTAHPTGAGAGGRAGEPGAVGVETIRIQKGAVTERAVRDAAGRGARLVLARQAVLTPLARDMARALGVQIEREARC